jgi:hypothetical protein
MARIVDVGGNVEVAQGRVRAWTCGKVGTMLMVVAG